MEKELNIAAILRDKPKNIKLWSPMLGECKLFELEKDDDFESWIRVIGEKAGIVIFRKDGKYSKCGEVCLFPSKQMQDWSKFAWKKGDVLKQKESYVIFDYWLNTYYTCFRGVYLFGKSSAYEVCCNTDDFIRAKQPEIDTYISAIEKEYGGKLNLSTLDIEQPKQEFKDGDIVVLDKATKENLSKIVAIYKTATFDGFNSYTYLNVSRQEIVFGYQALYFGRVLRPATEEEKQQLFDALAKENKRWNPDTKQIEDLPKKCELKPFDKVLVRDRYNDEWMAGFFSHIESSKDVVCTSGSWKQCIPYNEETAHLLGTTDEWEGGEE